MSLRLLIRRVELLERPQPAGQKTFDQALADFVAVDNWLAERGYADHLAAIEAGESGPEGLEALLREYAGYDRRHRAFGRVEAALDAGKLPDDADLRLLGENAGRSVGG